MKMVTIYVDSAEWDMVKESARELRVSAGRYLLDLHEANVGGGNAAPSNVKWVSIDELKGVYPEHALDAKNYLSKPDPVKKAKLKKVEEMITSSDKDIFFNPVSKDRQVGKK